MRSLQYIGITLALVAALGSQLAQAQRFAPGYCPTVTAHENFDKTKFFGNWIEVEKTPSIFDLMMRCLVVDYSDDQDNTVNVVVRGISLAGLPLTVNGDGLLQDVHRSGFYSIRYGFGVPFQGTLTTIIDTDYDDYAVVYSCTNSLLSGVFHSEYIWVLSRSGKISNPTRQNIYEKLDKLQINRSGLTMSDRSTCPTNSSQVARESDKDLAGQPVAVGGGGVQAGSASPGAADAAQASPSSSPTAALEKAGPQVQEPAQKSVVVPLLYDAPTAASSSSVGVSPAQKPAQKQAAPAAPVDGKPVVAAVKPAAVKPVAASVAAAAAAPAAPVAAPASAASAAAAQPASAAQAAPASPQAPPKAVQAPNQQQSLLNKIQQKP